MTNNPFGIVGQGAENASEAKVENTDAPLKERIEALLSSSDVFLFMKGTADYPQCGFSSNTVGMLRQAGVEFKTFDILSDMDIRQGVKEYANWPTYPQLWVKGKLIGGNDIITEMFHSGDLAKILN